MLLYIAIVLILITIFCFFSRIWNDLTAPKSNCFNCLVRNTVLITGGTKGMGYAAALEFAKRGARVIITSRRREYGERARTKIVAATGNSDVIVKKLNLASFKSIWAFSYEMLNVENRLDVLINNVGVIRPNGITEDGFHPTFQVNAIGTFLLTVLLLDLLKSTKNSRVVNVTTPYGVDLINFTATPINRHDNWFTYFSNYTSSKRLLGLLMLELADQLRAKQVNVTINFSIPRACRTELQLSDHLPDIYGLFKKHILFPSFYLKPEQSVESTVYCALSSQLNASSGCFYKDCKQMRIAYGNLGMKQKAAWKMCWKWLKMHPSEYGLQLE